MARIPSPFVRPFPVIFAAAAMLGLGCTDQSADLDEDGWTIEQGDCDDGSAAVHPGATEVPYDRVDDDCTNGDLADVDDDGHAGQQAGGDDCNDQDPNVFGGAVEACNGQDDNCDGQIDEGLEPQEYLADADEDGYGAGDIVTDCSSEAPEGHVPAAGPVDCDDTNPAVSPVGIESCNAVDDDCDGEVDEDFDADGDGVTLCGPDGDPGAAADNDCDDANPQIHPGAPEQCNGIDDDCSGEANDQQDADGDGFTPCGEDDVPGGGDDDCDDAEPLAFPGNTENCDAIDNDCDAVIDNGFDADGDLVTICGPDGDPFTPDDNDCDDLQPLAFPGNSEVCDALDNDCDAVVDNGFDLDADGVTTCGPDGDPLVPGDNDCDDAQSLSFPGNVETCDAIDNDCDAVIDNGFDGDEDGSTLCGPDGDIATTADNDCDDTQPLNFPGNTEVCDGIDNDCDGSVDPGGDVDGDGVSLCGPDGLPGTADDDCDDAQPLAFPGNSELCDAIDNDCNSTTDDGFDLDADGVTVCGPDGDPLTDADNDCDDAQPLNFPGNPEICDALDNDCDVTVDNGFDMDEDGVTTCGADGDALATADNDCDDAQALSFPGNPEICDAIDNDCDLTVDNGFDLDADLVTTCGPDGDPGTPIDNDCDDAQPLSFPGNPEVCDAIDNDCDSVTDDGFDIDADGVTTCGADGDDTLPADNDCDDAQPLSFPGNPEVCDAIDNDCDLTVDNGFDLDADLVTTCGLDGDPGTPIDNDCDDTEPLVFPGNPEVCDAIDNDCDGVLDNGFDADADGVTSCGPDGDPLALADNDCNDAEPLSFPGNPELCDAIDNDCNAAVDDGFDGDGDGVTTCGPDGSPSTTADNDCDDAEPLSFPGNPELCDGIDNDCSGGPAGDEVDGDGDGVAVCENDCDDTRDTVFPANPEVCDGLDNDCSGSLPAGETDVDADDYLACGGFVDEGLGFLGGGDCDDNEPTAFPGNPEICDGLDNDCLNGPDADGGGEADLDLDTWLSCLDCDDAEPAAFPGNSEVCDGIDNDCAGGVPANEDDADGDTFRVCGGDCDDAVGAVNPGAAEACDGLDTDCAGGLDAGETDGDADLYLVCTGFVDQGIGLLGGDDCADALVGVNPGATEICDGYDNDCSGGSSTPPALSTETDDDGDLYIECTGWVDAGLGLAGGDDCGDADPARNPAAPEICDLVDNDCDGLTDAADPGFTGSDADGDGALSVLCGGSDCDDSDATANPFDYDLDGTSTCASTPDCDDSDYYNEPGLTEFCDGLDNNCDGLAQDTSADGDADGQTGVPCGGTDCDDSDPHVFSYDVYGSGYHQTCLPVVYPGIVSDWFRARVEQPWVLDDTANTGLYYMYFRGHYDPGSAAYPVGNAFGVISSVDGVTWDTPDATPIVTRNLTAGAWDGAQLSRPAVIFLPGAARPYLLYYHGRVMTATDLREVGLVTATSPLGPFDRLSPDGDPLPDSLVPVGVAGNIDEKNVNQVSAWYDAGGATVHLWYQAMNNSNAVAVAHASSPDGVTFTKTDTAAAGSPDPILSPAGGSAWDESSVQFPFVMDNSDPFDVSNVVEVFYGGRRSSPPTNRLGVAHGTSATSWTRCTSSPVLSPPAVANRTDSTNVFPGSVQFLADGTTATVGDGEYQLYYSGIVADANRPYGTAAFNYSNAAAYVMRAQNRTPDLFVNVPVVAGSVTVAGTITDDGPDTVTIIVQFTHATLPMVQATVTVAAPPSPGTLGEQTSAWTSTPVVLGSGAWTATAIGTDQGCAVRRQSIAFAVP